jgi:hypothetical protein
MSPVFKIIYIVLSIVLLYYMMFTVAWVLNSRCGDYRADFLIEKFDDMTKEYSTVLDGRVKGLQKRTDAASALLDAVQSKFDNLQSSICDVNKQIDDGISQNYASNVPADEYDLPADVQKQRAADRKTKAANYIKNQRAAFVQQNKSPLIECFDDVKDAVIANVDEVEANVGILEKGYLGLKNAISDKQIAVYYTTMTYNEKYLKKLVQEMQKTTEGFVDQAPVEPGTRLEDLSNRISVVEDGLKLLGDKVDLYTKATKGHAAQLTSVRSITKTKPSDVPVPAAT